MNKYVLKNQKTLQTDTMGFMKTPQGAIKVTFQHNITFKQCPLESCMALNIIHCRGIYNQKFEIRIS